MHRSTCSSEQVDLQLKVSLTEYEQWGVDLDVLPQLPVHMVIGMDIISTGNMSLTYKESGHIFRFEQLYSVISPILQVQTAKVALLRTSTLGTGYPFWISGLNILYIYTFLTGKGAEMRGFER